MKKIWLSMFYSIQVGEDPDSVFLKKQRNQNMNFCHCVLMFSGLIMQSQLIQGLNFHVFYLESKVFKELGRPNKVHKLFFTNYDLLQG